jgi:hypothetical protein
MTWKDWRELWHLDRDIKVPHASIIITTPYAFVRFLWHYNRRPFQAYPSQYETGLVLGWRWPFAKTFRERKWLKFVDMPIAVYGGPMDEIYLVRAMKELLLLDAKALVKMTPNFLSEHPELRHIGPTVNVLLHLGPQCDHNFWVATCPQCARKALRLAIQLKTKYEPVKLIDPHEDPLKAFQRRQAEAEARLGVPKEARSVPELEAGNAH